MPLKNWELLILHHYKTTVKVDVFLPKTRPYDQEALHRVKQDTLDEEGNERLFYLAAPEDVILNKLEWYKMGGEVSDRQWNDVLGVLKVQGMALDMMYLKKWAGVLGVGDLLERALVDAGM